MELIQDKQLNKSSNRYLPILGKAKRILAFVTPDKAKDAKQVGADIIAGDEQIEELKKEN